MDNPTEQLDPWAAERAWQEYREERMYRDDAPLLRQTFFAGFKAGQSHD